MKKFQVWVEGFQATGEWRKAQLVGEIWADSFDNAVQQLYKERYPDEAERNRWFRKSESGFWVEWGCRIYDNEADARKSFG